MRIRPKTANLVKIGQKKSITLHEDLSPILLMPAALIGHESTVVKHRKIFIPLGRKDLNNSEKALLLMSSLTMVRHTCHKFTSDITTAM